MRTIPITRLTIIFTILLWFSPVSVYSLDRPRVLTHWGYDTSGRHHVSLSGTSNTTDVQNSFSLGGEVFAPKNHMDAGFGIEYELVRSLKGLRADFNYIPLYAAVRYFPLNEARDYGIVPFFTGRLGYSYFFGTYGYTAGQELHGGMYSALGLGLVFEQFFQFEAIYSVCNGSARKKGFTYETANIRYSHLGLYCGIRF